jgi:hypothetical protein
LLYDRYIFVTVDLLRERGKLEERDSGRVDAAEQESRCGLTLDRVRLPVDEKARI